MRRDGMAPVNRGLLIGLGASLALAGCAAEPVESIGARPTSPNTATANGETQPGPVRTGAQTSGMAAQYTAPRAGAISATGASAWVPPAPAPAFVITELPPADPPEPPLAAAANRQPASAPRRSVETAQDDRP